MRRSLTWILVAIPLLAEGQTQMHVPSTMRVLTHREQVPLVGSWIEKRFEVLLPALMRREGIDMWVIVTREYNNDPVFRSMAPLTTYSSRRRTILVFFDRGGAVGVERLSISQSNQSSSRRLLGPLGTARCRPIMALTRTLGDGWS